MSFELLGGFILPVLSLILIYYLPNNSTRTAIGYICLVICIIFSVLGVVI